MNNIEQLIDKLHLEDLQNEMHPSTFDTNDLYDIFIVRIPVISNELSAKSFGFILTEEKSYLYNTQRKEFEELENRFISVYSVIDKNIDKLLKHFLKYQETISDMEETLYEEKNNENFLNNWLSIKLEILRIERILLRTAGTIDDFIKNYEHTENFPITHYTDIYEHIDRTMRSATLQLSKLDYLYSFYNAKSNDKMNKMIYLLTIISAVFLPLNLVVGFFGMNTSGLPLAEGTNGTYFAISFMLSLGLITLGLVQFWRKKVEK